MWKKIAFGVFVFALFIFSFMSWYKAYYSMGVADSYEVNSPKLKHKILVATQGSEFKRSIVSGIIEHLKQRPSYLKIIDVSALSQVNENDWDALVILHTWENWQPQADAKAFLEGVKDSNKVIVLTTSGNGTYKMEGVDAITSASVKENVPSRILEVTKRLDLILEAAETQ